MTQKLEGDGLRTDFYSLLYKRNTKTNKECGVIIPDTIVFNHNFPRAWYTTELNSGEITKRQGNDLDAAAILREFSKTAHPQVDIVASYICSYTEEDEEGNTRVATDVEFFNSEAMKEFVARKEKKEGILQRFILPKGIKGVKAPSETEEEGQQEKSANSGQGSGRNSVIQAIWSPYVCLVQRRTNKRSIKDKVQCATDPYPCAVTYEGPAHYSEEGTCSEQSTDKIKLACQQVVQHYAYVNNFDKKIITRMVLYFKLDEEDRVWLLWCGSLREGDFEDPHVSLRENYHRFDTVHKPLNLGIRFKNPSVDDASSTAHDTTASNTVSNDDRQLIEADGRHLRMSKDVIFYDTYVKPMLDGFSKDSPKKRSATERRGESNANGSDPNQKGAKGSAQAGGANSGLANGDTDDWRKDPQIQNLYQKLINDREIVRSAMEDVFYEAYGHFLKYEPGPFVFELPHEVTEILGADDAQAMMQACRIEQPSKGVEDGALDSEHYHIQPNHPKGPVRKLNDAVHAWIQTYFSQKESQLEGDSAGTSVQKTE